MIDDLQDDDIRASNNDLWHSSATYGIYNITQYLTQYDIYIVLTYTDSEMFV